MASFVGYESRHVIKMLLMGDSGAGKSGALMSLAAAGYNLRILDWDNGVELLNGYLTNSASPYLAASPLGLWPKQTARQLIDRVRFETLTDPMRKGANGQLVPAAPRAFNRGMALLTDWKSGEDSFGSVATWSQNDILVIDSLTRMGDAAMNLAKALNNRLGQKAHQSDWWDAQQRVEEVLKLIADASVACHVIMIAHVKRVEEEGAPPRGLPEAPGSALSPRIPTYFNHTLLARTTGQGTSERHKLIIKGNSLVELKTTNPLGVKNEYDLGTGLAEYFAAVLGRHGPAVSGSGAQPQ